MVLARHEEMNVFKLDLNANVSMTSRKGSFVATFPQMIERFGPGLDRGYKVSKEWSFTDGTNVFTVYDWKSTSLYSEICQKPEKLWASDEPYEFHVGGYVCSDSFVNWIAGKLGVSDEQETFVIEWSERHTIRVKAGSSESALDTFLDSTDLEEDHGYPSMTFCEILNVNLVNETHKIKEGFVAGPVTADEAQE